MSVPLRAPRADGAILADPPFEQVDSLIAHNRRLFDRSNLALRDRSLRELRALARREAIEAARSYHSDSGEDPPAIVADSLALSGHQPELFHPGVWVKNFALHRIARQSGATPLALIVDNDTVKSTSLRLPARKAEGWYRLQLPFDFHGADVPYEERTVADESLFASFADRAAATMSAWNFTPMLREFWNDVLKCRERTPLLGERFAAARRNLERRWGCHNLELPVSRLCSSESFAWFVQHLLEDLPRFHKTYNAVVREYRVAHGIRSRNHPVPDLTQDGDWLEAPLWVWRIGEQRRGRLFARSTQGSVQLRMGGELFAPDSGFKLRPRALTTTLFARLLLADLFIHGIGGAKYDALTDELLRRFYNIEPPRFMTLSATLLLPFNTPIVDGERCETLERELRDVWFNPQRHLSSTSDVAARRLAEEKEHWIRRTPAVGEGKLRHEKLHELSAKLRPCTADARERLERELRQCREHLESQAVLMRRDYAFCLFPEEKLGAFCRRFL